MIDPRTKIYRLVQRIDRYFVKTMGEDPGATAMRLNREMSARFRPASTRTHEQHVAALDWLTMRWESYKVANGVKESEVPEYDEPVVEPWTCTICEETRRDEPVLHEEHRRSDDQYVCRDCADTYGFNGAYECVICTEALTVESFAMGWLYGKDWNDDMPVYAMCPYHADEWEADRADRASA